ncbi:hypothetical protein [Symmachiella dynata]|nr:hypothetical protein [Symmachiella dynata]
MSDSSIMWMHSDAIRRAREYAKNRRIELKEQLGAGYDGVVFSTNQESVIKSLRFDKLYHKERDVYLRLRKNHIEKIEGFAVPALVDYDDFLWVVEIEIVSPPFVVDFAGASLDTRSADYPPEVYEEWEREKREQFGQNWPKVLSILSGFRRYGIYLADVKPGNIEFAPDEWNT